MPAIAEAAAQARLLARRGASAAAVVIGASFHPFRTVRDGATVVRGLVSPPADPIPGAPTDAQQQPAATATETATTPKSTPKSPSKPAPTSPSKPRPKPTAKTPPGPDVVAKPPAPPVPEAASTGEDEDRPVVAGGPAPHIPPRIAGEVERDYGDDLPGITHGDEPDDLTDEEG